MSGCRNLTNAEIELFLNNLERQRDRTLFVLGIKTGFRITELLSIKIKDVYQFHKIVDRVKVTRNHTKGKLSSREVILHPTAKLEIVKLLSEFKTLDQDFYLFRSRKGENKPIGRIQAHTILKEIVNKLRLQGPIATHSMRKSFADRVYTNYKFDLRKTQLALGHTDINNTIKYINPDQKDIDDGILLS